MKRAKPTNKRPTPEGRLDLTMPGGEYGELVGAGVLGAIPVTTWLMMLLTPFGLDHPAPPGTIATVAGVAFIVITLLTMLILPWLVPVLVLRARQPRGARVEWNEDGVVEWDGPWKKTSIAWPDVRAAHLSWITKTRSGSVTDEALQIFGTEPGAVISLWTSPPPRVPSLRRRIVAKRLVDLREAIASRRIPLSDDLDFGLAGDPDRPPHRALSIVGRIGYPLAVVAPLLVLAAPVAGVVVGAVAAPLLAVRAVPAFREVMAIRARHRPAPRVAPAADDAAGPYRAAPESSAGEDEGLIARDRLKARAAIIEAVVRASCVVLTLTSTAFSLAFLR